MQSKKPTSPRATPERLAALALALLALSGCMELLEAPPTAVGFVGATVPPGFRGDGSAFVYSDPPEDTFFGASTSRMGLMHPSGAVIMPAVFDAGYRVDEGIQGETMMFVFTRELVTERGKETIAYLIDGNGAILAEGPYANFTCANGVVVGERYEIQGENEWTQHYDLFGRDGKLIKAEAFSGYVQPSSEGFLSETVGDSGNHLYTFYDDRAKVLSTVEAAELRWGGLPEDAPALYPFREKGGGGMGYLDARGQVAIQPLYALAEPFQGNGYAKVQLEEGRSTLIDTQGGEVLPTEYEAQKNLKGLILASQGKEQVLLDDGFAVIATLAGGADVSLWGEGGESLYALAQDGKALTLILADGRQFDLPRDVSVNTMDAKAFMLHAEKDNLIYILNTDTGDMAQLEGTWGYIADEDHFIVHNLDSTSSLYDSAGSLILTASSVAPDGYGRWVISRERFGQTRFGVVDGMGKELLPVEYAELSPMYDAGLYRARKGGLTGYVGQSGDWVYSVSGYLRLED